MDIKRKADRHMYAVVGGLFLVLMGVFLSGCISEADLDKAENPSARENRPEYNVSKLVIGVSGSLTEIQMNLKSYVLTNYLMLFTNEGFIGYDENGSVVPRLAKSWETNDSKRYVVHLVENATWNDGVPFTSEDVKFTFDYMEKNSLPAGESFYKMIDSIETPDDHTVVLNLKNTDATVFSRMSVLSLLFRSIFLRTSNPWRHFLIPLHYSQEQDLMYLTAMTSRRASSGLRQTKITGAEYRLSGNSRLNFIKILIH